MELTLQTSQRLILSQKMLQSVEVLQMDSQALKEYVEELSATNPIIELDEELDARSKNTKDKIEYLLSFQPERNAFFSRGEEDGTDRWNTSVQGQTLWDHLLFQLYGLAITKKERIIAEYIINSIDTRGYLADSIESIADHFGVHPELCENILQKIQAMDPPGVACRDLVECLLLQVRRNGICNPNVSGIIQSFLVPLAKNQIPYIAKQLKISVDETKEAIQIIKTLNPKPGNSFGTNAETRVVRPDAYVIRDDDGFSVRLNESGFPKLMINSYYKEMINHINFNDAKGYLNDKLKQAEWAMQCLQLRNDTLYKTVSCIVKKQQQFFEDGKTLTPLKLADVADEVGLHESTISRAVKEKYLQCQFGVFPLCSFFKCAIETQYNQSVTPDFVKEKLQQIIENEDGAKPKSDREIADGISREGIVISRRTVAKYREELGIPCASGRKTF